jgi:immunoglobulin heavy chain
VIPSCFIRYDWISQPQQWQALIVWNNKFYSSVLKSQLTISKDSFNNQVFLTMTCMEPTDTATHFCLRHHKCTATGTSSTWSQAVPQCCLLLCASGKCGEVSLSCKPLGFPLQTRDSQPCLPDASLILDHSSPVRCHEVSSCFLCITAEWMMSGE